MEGVYVHNYGKALCREGRKMGHITITGTNKEKILIKLAKVRSIIKVEGVEDE
jgi:phosphoribosylaminoimidazole carboxylase (NCAIR synthetase)